jgi:uncharacterized protein YraI
MKRLALLITLLVAGCVTVQPVATPSATFSLSPSSTHTPTSRPTSTRLSLTATPLLIDGVLTIKVNVRNGPGTTYTSLGQLDSGGEVRILAQDSQGAWYKILYSGADQGYGWVAARYVTVANGTQAPMEATPTSSGPSGTLTLRVNVRSGPATTFDSLGMLEAGTVVSLTGKNTTTSWFQIRYPTAASGYGWVTSQYVQTDSSTDLPVLDDYGNVVTPGASGAADLLTTPATPTIGPAHDDGDSSTHPVVCKAFSASGTLRCIYSSQVSAPQGDTADWVEFTPYAATGSEAHLSLSLACTGNSTLAVELWQGSTLLTGWGNLACGGAESSLRLSAGQAYLLHLAPASGDGLRLVAYMLTIQDHP